ncbi:hypothetical protein SADUNF_Sadunf17G0073500 [Salix dunnii]|uniref:Clp1 C-terminal domain-containing protein n=1 Tax=Salix dunnii TaxID=1413687 RepID=A0A835MEX4_9ROSI|nr:hypothetical protein SADUNF_Sadunf17G0073500 [Salix dunnii]
MLKINITFRYLSFVFCFPNPRISNLHFTGSKSVMKDNIDRDLLQVFLAVSYAQEPDQIVSSNVAGFIYVTDIDLQRRKITCLSPTAGELAMAGYKPQGQLFQSGLTLLPNLCELHPSISIEIYSMLLLQFNTPNNLIKLFLVTLLDSYMSRTLIFKVAAPRSALPIGADPVANPLRVAPVNMDRYLLHFVLAV